MLFNSIEFAFFLPVVFLLYWFVFQKDLKLQNFFLLVVSYFFYGWWDWRFLSLIIISSFVDYFLGLQIAKEKEQRNKKLLLFGSILVNLGFLCFFKYYNFFLDNFLEAFSFFGTKPNISTLKIILPVGISFYTFQTLSYSIDIYRGKLEPSKDIISFFAFVSFFPQLVAGPIERAVNLLPQFYKKRNFNYQQAADGCRQILWGFFKKVVIADSCAIYVNDIFGNSAEQSGSTLLLGAIYFAFQIYCDFSGYSDIAIGTSRLFGFNLMKNFNFPYFSRDIAEFWRRWHISLSTWFRDYVYIPLGGSRVGELLKVRNVFAIFLISGFWHGANWTFLAWGFLNALYFLPSLLSKRNRQYLDTPAKGKLFPGLRELFAIGSTFLLTVLAWIFFRAENIGHAFEYIGGIFSRSLFNMPSFLSGTLVLLIFILIAVEWLQREKEHGLELAGQKIAVRWGAYVSVFLLIFFNGNFENNSFIYFQF